MSLLQELVDLIFPPRCYFCRCFLPHRRYEICEQCERDLPYTTKSTCKVNGAFFEYCVAPVHYSGVVRDSILRFKFGDKFMYADYYGKLVAQCILDNVEDEYDFITWVPLSKKRERERGYDQAKLLAEAAAKQLGKTVCRTLKKHKNITAQSIVNDPAARRANVSGVYEVTDPELIRDKRILIIDDVITTGATVSECSRMLLMGGAECVYAAAFARAKNSTNGLE